jgi:hypothetical protein
MAENTCSKNSKPISFVDKRGNKLQNQPSGLNGDQEVVEETIPKVGLDNKHARLYKLRYSRATHLAQTDMLV